jgi:hypothetical protein
MFRLLGINCSESFLSPEQDHPEVLVRQTHLPQDLGSGFVFQIERAQHFTVAIGELVEAMRDGLPEFEGVRFRQSAGGRLGHDFRHLFIPQVSAAIFGNHVAADADDERADRFRVVDLIVPFGQQESGQGFLHDVVDVRAVKTHVVAYFESYPRPELPELAIRQIHVRPAFGVRSAIQAQGNKLRQRVAGVIAGSVSWDLSVAL